MQILLKMYFLQDICDVCHLIFTSKPPFGANETHPVLNLLPAAAAAVRNDERMFHMQILSEELFQ